MRNLRKILALALVFAIVFTFTASAADFTDAKSIGTNYIDDVNMLVELGVLAGYPDGSFGPQKNITRAEFAKMAYTLKY
ncbi:MAG: S-layer homology domain-containing protein, partial [Oscillospiraceae bacterium]|nr:S-layer homology domain-containing protein [Oscillospiraceae bacterium]